VKKATRKIYLSLIFVAASILTMVATTFAWVGIVSNASFEKISINLETDNEESDYGIMLSLTGKEGDFHDNIDSLDLQKQILINMGVNPNILKNEMNIRSTFNALRLSPCTVTRPSVDSFTLHEFRDLKGNKPVALDVGSETDYNGYFEFDVFVTIYKIGEDINGSENKLSIYLRNSDGDSIMSSGLSSSIVANTIVFPDDTLPLSSQYLKASYGFAPGKTITGEVFINPANATRLAVQKAKSVRLYDYRNSYNSLYQGLRIYKTGTDLPRYDSKYDYYDFGGILPTDYNFARLLYNSTRRESEWLGEVPMEVLPENRGDVTFVDDGVTNHIVDSTDSVTTADMIKLHFSFWFEGWDADCFEAIDDQMVSVNLSFSTKNPNDEG